MSNWSRTEIEAAWRKFVSVGDSGDWNAWADLHSPDGVWVEHHLGTFQGREAIRKAILEVMKPVPMMRFPVAWHAMTAPLTAGHWIALAGVVLAMAFFEGYRGFQQGFSPRVAARARHLSLHPTPLRTLLAPLFCIGYFGAPRARRIASIAVSAGIVVLSPGAYVNAGTAVVTLQQLDPVYADFFVPQRNLGEIRVGQRMALRLDAYPGREFEGLVSAIAPKVDGDTRNARVEASLPNPDGVLMPGMFANVAIEVGEQKRQLTLPQTAITFNPYGETVYVVKPGEGTGADGKPALPTAQQVFVTTGPTRGDQVAVLSGLEEGTEVVTSGQLKLKNGTPLVIDNARVPKADADPKPQES